MITISLVVGICNPRSVLVLAQNPLLFEQNACFADKSELEIAVYKYVKDPIYTSNGEDCANNNQCEVGQRYGYPIGTWCVENVTDMSSLFDGYGLASGRLFNEDISSWDVSRVTSMENMFRGARAFNQDLSSWDVSRVVSMYDMFMNAASFNSDVSSWNVSNVISMKGMFNNADTFNGDLSAWDISQVTDLNFMFWHATSFNQDLCAWGDQYPYASVNDTIYSGGYDIFAGTKCTFLERPELEQRGPFCNSSCGGTNSSVSSSPSAAIMMIGVVAALLLLLLV